MVLLTMTSAMVKALESLESLEIGPELQTCSGVEKTAPILQASTFLGQEKHKEGVEKNNKVQMPAVPVECEENKTTEAAGTEKHEESVPTAAHEPLLSSPKIGDPISHGQVVELWKKLKLSSLPVESLDTLLQGAQIYTPPPKPKSEPTSEYKALMARLRREEEERSYYRLTNPAPPMETFAQRFPLSSAAHAFASSQQTVDTGEEVTYEEVKRQMGLIINVLVSIICCAVAIWKAARWWSTPPRLALSLSGSLLVGVAEVVIYMGYIRRVGESKQKEKNMSEVKEIVRTWVVGGDNDDKEADVNTLIPVEAKENSDGNQARRRRKEAI